MNIESLFSHLPLGAVNFLGRLFVQIRPLKPYPGWHFGIFEEDPDLSTRCRLAVWKYYQQKDIKQPLAISWYNEIQLNLCLGNDTSRLLYVGGCFEPNEFYFLNRILRPGMVFIDVGANEGLYTLFAAKRVGSEGKVLAIEPSKREYRKLQSNIALNQLRNVRTFPYALYSESGLAQLSIAEYEHAGQNTVGKSIPNPRVKRASLEEVELQTLDQLFEKQDIKRLDFVKIDAEGAEMQVLIGGEKNIRHHLPLLQLEISEAALKLQGCSRSGLRDLLHNWGYVLYGFDEKARLHQMDSFGDLDSNIIAAPAGRVLN